MEYEINNIYCADSRLALQSLPDDYVDLTVTSPPYDNLRDYTKEFSAQMFDWRGIIKQLYRVTKSGGVVVWVVADATIKGSETGTSFRQALYAMDCGFNLHDTMIYEKKNYIPLTHNRYEQAFEYAFVLSKDKPKTFNPIMKENKTVRKRNATSDFSLSSGKKIRKPATTKKQSFQNNIWRYNVGYNVSTKDKDAFNHPAIFPEQLAHDHIISWSNPGDLVLDPFMGSGTVAKMAQETGRKYLGFDLSPEYVEIAKRRVQTARIPLFAL